jgi:uncharacterized protein (DUF2236 family)
MSALPEGRPGEWVTPAEIDTLIAGVVRRAAGEREGIFGPGSACWKVNRESAVFLGAGRAALLQLAHPWVATALEQHSSVMSQPIARFHNTFRIVYTMIFGSLAQAKAAARHLYKLHTRITGELTESAGEWPRGAHYEANEMAALRWVFATLIQSAELAYTCALGPMAADDRERYYAESRMLAGLFGLPEAALPEDWNGFENYNRAMYASGELGVTRTARKMARELLAGAGSWLEIPQWYRALTTEWMPERLREEFRLTLTDEDRSAAAAARVRIPRVYRRLPAAVRFVGPWHEAQARLAGRGVGLAALIGNRFWIGQMKMPFADAS